MSTTAWPHIMERTSKYDDVMAEFRANGRDSDPSCLTGAPVSTAPSTQTVTQAPVTPPVTATPCSLCGLCPPLTTTNDINAKDMGSVSVTSPGLNTSATVPTLNSLNTQFANMDLMKMLIDKPVTGIENIWQLGTRPITAPIGSINYQLQRLQQLRQKKPGLMMGGFQECVFCRNNGEQASFYRSHELKDQLGRVVCPVLRNFTCPCCGATGDNAHTIKYCPEKGPDFIPSLALKQLRLPNNTKRRIPIPRRFTGSQELGTWFTQE